MMMFLEPHAICLSPEPLLIWLLVIFNAGIAAAYFAIPIAMAVYMKFERPPTILYLFMAFILGCGVTHIMQVVTMYVGGLTYWIEMLTCGATFIVSACTAMVLLTQGPRLKHWTRSLLRE